MTNSSTQSGPTKSPPAHFRTIAILLVLGYLFGLTRDLTESWVGLHDWNGAFFSQLARNFNRYPLEIHHGIPIVAAGAETPSSEQRSLYSTHPPGLVWLVAGVFGLFGESEAVARIPFIFASAGTFALLLWIWRVAFGSRFSLLAGAVYAVMPMTVYFGRMVDHETICLFLMTAACATWIRCQMSGRKTSLKSLVSIAALLVVNVWIDWSAWIFAGVFCAYLLLRGRMKQFEMVNSQQDKQLPTELAAGSAFQTWHAVAISSVTTLSIAALLIYMVGAGLAGHWSDLAAIFFTRVKYASGTTQSLRPMNPGDAWHHTIQNFTLPLLTMAAVGLIVVAKARSTAFYRFEAETEQEKSAKIEARWSLFLLTVTGALWLSVFFRQYEVHQYWAFYLGPAIAMLAALAYLFVKEKTQLAATRVPRAALNSVFLAALFFCSWGTRDYFAIDRPELTDRVSGWSEIARQTLPTDRIALFRNPIWTEVRGHYAFRNIIPPQFAYYCDRAFDVRRDIESIAANHEHYAFFVIPVDDAVNYGASLRPLRIRYPEVLLNNSLVVFDLRIDRLSKNPPPFPSTTSNPAP